MFEVFDLMKVFFEFKIYIWIFVKLVICFVLLFCFLSIEDKCVVNLLVLLCILDDKKFVNIRLSMIFSNIKILINKLKMVKFSFK